MRNSDDDLLSGLRRRLGGERRPPWHGPTPRLPELAERAAERWYALPPRVRLAAGTSTVLLLLLLTGAGAARSPWGPPVEVMVAATDLPAGARLTAADLDRTTRPAALVPPDALQEAVAVGGQLGGSLLAGDVLTARHLLGDDGIAAGLSDGRAAYPIDATLTGPLPTGQRVDVVAGAIDGRGRVLAHDARVLTVTDGTVWLDVARREAPALAGAAAREGLQLVLLPP